MSKVKFASNGHHLLSLGGGDKCIFQWKYTFDIEGDIATEKVGLAPPPAIDENVGVDTRVRSEQPKSPEDVLRAQHLEEELNLSQPRQVAVSRHSVRLGARERVGRDPGREHPHQARARVPVRRYSKQPEVDEERLHLIPRRRLGDPAAT